jgi:Molybdopterin-binding domain of aldehyde dehydrogenase
MAVAPVKGRLAHLKDQRAIEVVKEAAALAQWDTRPSPKMRDGTARTGRGIATAVNNTYVAAIAEVEVDASGQIHVRRISVAHDCGLIINPDGLRNQIEGNLTQATSRALLEEVKWDASRVTSVDWLSYPILRFPDVPDARLALINRPEVRSTGAGEPVLRQPATAGLIEEPETYLRACASLVCSELVETRRLAVVLRQPATTVRIEDPETVLPACVSLVCGELVEAHRLAVVLRQPATAVRIEDPEIELPACVSLVCGELVETRRLLVVLRQATTAIPVQGTEIGLPACVSLVRGELVEACGFAVVLRQAAAAVRVEEPETCLRAGVSLVCGELVEARRLAVVLRQPAPRPFA